MHLARGIIDDTRNVLVFFEFVNPVPQTLVALACHAVVFFQLGKLGLERPIHPLIKRLSQQSINERAESD